MAPHLRIKSLRREDYQQAPAWFDALLLTLNQALGDTANALNGGLTFEENFRAELKTVEVTMPAEYPTWRAPGATGQPPYLNGWSAYPDATYGRVGFRMWPDGVVELQGLVQRGTVTLPSVIFNLPVGYRPPINLIVPATMHDPNSKTAELRVLTSGDVSLIAVPAYAGTVSDLSLSGVRFQAKGPAAKADLFGAPLPLVVKSSGRFGVKTCQVVSVTDKTDNSTGVLGPVHADWAQDKSGVTLNAIWGLQPGRKYDVTLLMTAG